MESTNRKWLSTTGIHEAGVLRRMYNIGLTEPINIYDLIQKMKLELRFQDLPSLEGMYFKDINPLIVISSLRPLGRKAFTIAHEIAHHYFKHGNVVDEVKDESDKFQPEEYIADIFAGSLLMTKTAICNTCKLRKWDVTSLNPTQLYTLSCYFGVGYETLVNHMLYTAKILKKENSDVLLRAKVKNIKQSIIGEECTTGLTIIDKFWRMNNIDVEVGDLVLLPHNSTVLSDNAIFIKTVDEGTIYKLTEPGIKAISINAIIDAVNLRIMRKNYIGRSIYKNLEEVE